MLEYLVRFRLHGINNAMVFHSAPQYQNFLFIMEIDYQDQFELIEIITRPI